MSNLFYQTSEEKVELLFSFDDLQIRLNDKHIAQFQIEYIFDSVITQLLAAPVSSRAGVIRRQLQALAAEAALPEIIAKLSE